MTFEEEEEKLCNELEAWSKAQDIEYLSADEMLFNNPTKEQTEWLLDFIERWDDLMQRQQAARQRRATS